MLKCLVNLIVRGDLPPPGGAAAAINVVSSTSFQTHSSLSYRPLLSINSLSNSMGGCAPYCSVAGMLISSTKIAIFLPGCAPNNVLFFFSSLSSIDYYVLVDDVCAEKLMNIGTISFSSWNLAKLLEITTDLPTPV